MFRKCTISLVHMVMDIRLLFLCPNFVCVVIAFKAELFLSIERVQDMSCQAKKFVICPCKTLDWVNISNLVFRIYGRFNSGHYVPGYMEPTYTDEVFLELQCHFAEKAIISAYNKILCAKVNEI